MDTALGRSWYDGPSPLPKLRLNGRVHRHEPVAPQKLIQAHRQYCLETQITAIRLYL